MLAVLIKLWVSVKSVYQSEINTTTRGMLAKVLIKLWVSGKSVYQPEITTTTGRLPQVPLRFWVSSMYVRQSEITTITRGELTEVQLKLWVSSVCVHRLHRSKVVPVPSHLGCNKCWLYPGGGRIQKWSLYLPPCLDWPTDSLTQWLTH